MITNIQTYRAVKESGLPLLGRVPRHWAIRRLKTVCNMKSGDGITEESIESVGDYPVYGGNGIRGYTSSYNRDGTLVLIGRQGALCGNIHVASGRFWASEHAVVATPRSDYSPGWLGAILDAMNLNQYSISAAQPGLAVERLLDLPVPVPPVFEQSAIVRFLDHVDRRIQRYIRAKQKLIALLVEQKQAIIHQAVTGQIDVRTGKPYPIYKICRVEWLGSVPAHWAVSRLRHRYTQCLGKMLDTKRITGEALIPYLRNSDVQWGQINTEDLPTMDILAEEYGRYTVQEGDLLVCEGGDVGRCAIWSGGIEPCGFQKALHRLRPRSADRDATRFLWYVFRVAALAQAFSDGQKSTISHLTGDKLRAHRFVFPPVEEQWRIVDYLDNATEGIDTSIGRHRRQIDLLVEWRSVLIYRVVTGRLDVRRCHLPCS